jgi:GrpB-like predicted nucleotidyltransferase (UPF0157 family)
MSSRITIQDYDPLWPQQFETLRSRIAATLGEMAIAVEHVGSTAVPGLAAKPIIDIDILLKSSTDFPLVITRLSSSGYEHQGDLGITGREVFRPPPNDLPHHLYVCPPDSQEYMRHIAFRDHLRTHPEDANAYATLKRMLAGKFADDRDAYTQGKGEFVANILRSARRGSTRPEAKL